MSPEAQRIAIAEACPNIAYVCKPDKWGNVGGETFYVLGHPRANQPFNPLSDLNAMHEAEKVLNRNQRYQFVARLQDLPDEGFFATAAQRAEAFLRTLNLWKQ